MYQNISLEKYECYKIDLDEFSLRYYQELNIMSIEFWDTVEDDLAELTIYDETGFHLELSPYKDLEIFNKYLTVFKEQK